jgi:hypothetical protein
LLGIGARQRDHEERRTAESHKVISRWALA